MGDVPNPPAFSGQGMSLRDYFAGQALAGAMISPAYEGVEWDGIARECYAAADAMLLARTKGDAA